MHFRSAIAPRPLYRWTKALPLQKQHKERIEVEASSLPCPSFVKLMSQKMAKNRFFPLSVVSVTSTMRGHAPWLHGNVNVLVRSATVIFRTRNFQKLAWQSTIRIILNFSEWRPPPVFRLILRTRANLRKLIENSSRPLIFCINLGCTKPSNIRSDRSRTVGCDQPMNDEHNCVFSHIVSTYKRSQRSATS